MPCTAPRPRGPSTIFPFRHEPVPAAMIHAFGDLKAACAEANLELGKLEAKLADAIIAASNAVAGGKHDDALPGRHLSDRFRHVDQHERQRGDRQPRQREARLRPRRKGQKGAVHPNDHVNMGQSSNDTFPAAMHIARGGGADPTVDSRLGTVGECARRKGQGLGQDRQDRPHALDGCHADPRRPGVRRLRGPGPLQRDPRRSGARAAAGKHADRRHGRRHGHQHASEVRRQGVRGIEQAAGPAISGSQESSRGPGRQGFVRRGARRVEDDCRLAHQDRQRHSAARLRSAVQHL